MTTRLYCSRGSCSLAPRIVACEADLPVTIVNISGKTKQLPDGTDFRSVSAKGYVPVLELDDGTVLTEVAAIVQYLADLVPASHLAPPAGTLVRYRLQEWLHFVGTELHKPWGLLFYRSTPDDQKQAIRTRLLERIAHVEAALDGQAYLLGERFTAADAYLFTVLRWAPFTSVVLPSMVVKYVCSIAARPSVSAVLEGERLPKPDCDSL